MARCGTNSGYTAHQTRGEKPCDACATAKREYDQRWRAAGDNTKRNRLNAKAQARANAELKRLHPAEYRMFYEHYRDILLAEWEREKRHLAREEEP